MGESHVTPVAVIGMGCRLPGGIDSPERLWERCCGATTWSRGSGRPVGRRRVLRSRAGCARPVGVEVGRLPRRHRRVRRRVLRHQRARGRPRIDPQHRLLLETAWEAIEHAGHRPSDAWPDSLTGVFVGLDARRLRAAGRRRRRRSKAPYGFTGTNFSMASGRIAYSSALHGPAFTVDTACSSEPARGAPGLPQPARRRKRPRPRRRRRRHARTAQVRLGIGPGHAVADRTLPRVRRRARTGSCPARAVRGVAQAAAGRLARR